MKLKITATVRGKEFGAAIGYGESLLDSSLHHIYWKFGGAKVRVVAGAWVSTDNTVKIVRELVTSRNHLTRGVSAAARALEQTAKRVTQDSPAMAFSLMSFSVALDELVGVEPPHPEAQRTARVQAQYRQVAKGIPIALTPEQQAIRDRNVKAAEEPHVEGEDA